MGCRLLFFYPVILLIFFFFKLPSFYSFFYAASTSTLRVSTTLAPPLRYVQNLPRARWGQFYGVVWSFEWSSLEFYGVVWGSVFGLDDLAMEHLTP